jgi:hypothetical protein
MCFKQLNIACIHKFCKVNISKVNKDCKYSPYKYNLIVWKHSMSIKTRYANKKIIIDQ